MSTSVGPLMLLVAAGPSAEPAARDAPATVVVLRSGVIFRTLWSSRSATKRLPARSLVNPYNDQKRAASPAPSTDPRFSPVPATVVTSPVAVTRRMV